MNLGTGLEYILDFMNDTCTEGEDLTQYKAVPVDIVRELRRFVPTTAQVLHRGFSFETEEEALQFGDGILVQNRLSSWSLNKDVARGYASNRVWGVVLSANIGTSSMLVDIARTPINAMVGHTDAEIITLPGTYYVESELLTDEEVEEMNRD
jgi:hypothetical protein